MSSRENAEIQPTRQEGDPVLGAQVVQFDGRALAGVDSNFVVGVEFLSALHRIVAKRRRLRPAHEMLRPVK